MVENNPSNGGRNGNGNGNGVIKSVANVASRTVTALSGFPMLLVLTLLNAGMFGMMTYLIIKSAEYRYAERAEIIKILTNCIDDARKHGGAHYETPGWNPENTQKVNK